MENRINRKSDIYFLLKGALKVSISLILCVMLMVFSIPLGTVHAAPSLRPSIDFEISVPYFTPRFYLTDTFELDGTASGDILSTGTTTLPEYFSSYSGASSVIGSGSTSTESGKITGSSSNSIVFVPSGSTFAPASGSSQGTNVGSVSVIKAGSSSITTQTLYYHSAAGGYSTNSYIYSNSPVVIYVPVIASSLSGLSYSGTSVNPVTNNKIDLFLEPQGSGYTSSTGSVTLSSISAAIKKSFVQSFFRIRFVIKANSFQKNDIGSTYLIKASVPIALSDISFTAVPGRGNSNLGNNPYIVNSASSFSISFEYVVSSENTDVVLYFDIFPEDLNVISSSSIPQDDKGYYINILSSLSSIHAGKGTSLYLDNAYLATSLDTIVSSLTDGGEKSDTASDLNSTLQTELGSYESATDTSSQMSDVSSALEVMDVNVFVQLAATSSLFGSCISGIFEALGDFSVPLILFLTLVLISSILNISKWRTSSSYRSTSDSPGKVYMSKDAYFKRNGTGNYRPRNDNSISHRSD